MQTYNSDETLEKYPWIFEFYTKFRNVKTFYCMMVSDDGDGFVATAYLVFGDFCSDELLCYHFICGTKSKHRTSR